MIGNRLKTTIIFNTLKLLDFILFYFQLNATIFLLSVHLRILKEKTNNNHGLHKIFKQLFSMLIIIIIIINVFKHEISILELILNDHVILKSGC